MSEMEDSLSDNEQNEETPEKRKRKREPNFTAEEKALLSRLCNDNMDVLDPRLTDAKSLARKNAAWTSITIEFNAGAREHKRNKKTLKRAWDNIKAAHRRERGVNRLSVKVERPVKVAPKQVPPQPARPPKQEIIMVRGVPSIICEIDNEFDSDSVTLKPAESCDTVEHDSTDVVDNTQLDDVDDRLDKAVEDIKPTGRKASDYVRREATVRIKALEAKKQLETQILREQLATEEIRKVKMKIEMEIAEAKREAAKLELEFQKSRLRTQNNSTNMYYKL